MYLFLLAFFMTLGSGSLFAQQTLIDEGFENVSAGSLPQGWTQDPADAQKKWAVEKDLGNNLFDPAACATGKGRIKLTGNGNASGKEVMLVLPAVNATTLSEPILVFDWAAIKTSAGAVDSLKVYYRLRSDRDWTLAETYGEADNWKRDTIDFQSKTATFQIAFACVDNGGRGAVLDNIRFTSRPVCQPVTNVEVYNRIHNEAKLRWTGSLSAKYNVVIATQELADPANATEADGLFLRQTVEYATNMQINATANKALTPATTYYYYIQSDCGYGDVSQWVSGKFSSACLPVTDFSTSFDAIEDIACWTMIGESYGTYRATAPNVVPDSVQSGFHVDTGEPIFMTPDAQYFVKHSGAGSLWMPVQGESEDNYTRVFAVSPRLADDIDLSKKQISFWVHNNSKQIHLRVMVSEWPDDFSNAEESGEIVVRSLRNYEFFTVSFEDMKSNGKYIAFMVDGSEEKVSSHQFPMFNIDDLEFTDIQDCNASQKVGMFSIPEYKGNKTILKWNRTGAAKFNVKVSNFPFNPATTAGSVFDKQVEVPQVELEDLTPSTRYYYYVQPICGDGVVGSWSNTQSFDTDCAPLGVELPLRENFDNLGAATNVDVQLPVCWTAKLTSDEGYGIVVTNGNSYNPANSLYSYARYTTQFNTGFLITPKINADLKECQVRFAYNISNRRTSFDVGVMTDPTQESTFVKIKTITANEAGKWITDVVSLEDYTGNGKYVAFHLNEQISRSPITYRMDDIVVELQTSCADVKDVKQTSGSTASVTVDWTPSENEETAWEIAYGVKGAALGINTTTIPDVTAHPYEITGLSENAEYDVYVRSMCSADAAGRWVGPVTVRTVSPATLPYICDFESASVARAWNLKNGILTNQWIAGAALKGTAENLGDTTLYMSADYGASNVIVKEESNNYALRLLELEEKLVDFEFDWRVKGVKKTSTVYEGNTSRQVEYISANSGAILPFLVPEEISEQIVGGETPEGFANVTSGITSAKGIDWSRFLPEGWILLLPDTVDYLAAETADWQHYKFSYPMRKAGRYNLVIMHITPYQYCIDVTNNAVAVDNVSVKYNTTDCITPVDLIARDITQSSAKIHYLNYNADKWKVILSDSALTVDAELDNVTTATSERIISVDPQTVNPLVLEGLDPETRYYVYMRPECGDAKTWAGVEFSTICQSADVPLAYTFDEDNFTAGEGYYMDCWRRIPDIGGVVMQGERGIAGAMVEIGKFSLGSIATTNETKMLVFSSYSGEDSRSKYNGSTYAASPELTANVKDLMITFRAVSEVDNAKWDITMDVGVMTDPLDTATFELIETIRPMYAEQWKRYYVYFDGYKGVGRHIALRLNQMRVYNSKLYVDDLRIDSIKGCVPAREITVTDITPTTAKINWAVVGETGDYHVKVTTEPIGRWEERGNVYDDTIVAANSVVVDKLRASRKYYVYVRTVCTEEGGYSEGISDTYFRTGCAVEEPMPFYEDFETYELDEMPQCWTVVQGPDDYKSGCTYFNTSDIVYGPYKSIGRLSFSINSGSGGKFPGIVAMPQMLDADINELAVSFKGLKPGMNGRLVVGVIADLTDEKSFDAIDTINVVSPYKWEDIRVDFSKYMGNGKYIAFYLPPGLMTGDAFYIDNVVVRKSSVSCPDAAAPQELNITSNSATLRWADAGSEVSTFEVKVASQNINPEIEDGDVMATKEINDILTSVTGLQPATHYFAYIRHICNDEQGYWSTATEFVTACEGEETISYKEDFTGYGDISDMGFFPECWRDRLVTYGSISSDDQPAPYIENSTRPSLFMKSIYQGSDGGYAVVDAATPAINFGEAGVKGHMMTLSYKSNVKGAPIYVGLMSDPSDATTFVAYDTIRANEAGVWETQIVNFLYHEGVEKHIAFRINSLDAVPADFDPDDYNGYKGYQVNITDINVTTLEDCMPPYRVNADVRPNRAFISWLPGDNNSEEWKYYVGATKMDSVPFTDEEWNARNNDGWNMCIIDSTSEHSLVINGLEDWNDYYMYIKTNACNKFYPQVIDMSQDNRSTCGKILTLADMPVAPDFSNNGSGVGSDPDYSAYLDCWGRDDDFVKDSIAYPYIKDLGELYFHTDKDSLSMAYLPLLRNEDSDTLVAKTQFRFSAKALAPGAKMIVGFKIWGTETVQTGENCREYEEFDREILTPIDTIELTEEYADYTVKFEGFEYETNENISYDEVRLVIIDTVADFVMNSFVWEEIPYCFAPEMSIKSHDKTSYEIEWAKTDDQENWEVAYGPVGFDVENAKFTARTEPNYYVVNQKEGTAYEFYLRSFCLNGATSELERICVTTDQTPAVYPYSSEDFADATVIDAYDTIYYAYRTIDIPAGPNRLTFDWKLGADALSFLKVFTAPAGNMITPDMAETVSATTKPAAWTEVASLNGKQAWTAASYPMYVKAADAGTVNLIFAWTHSGADVKEVIRNIEVKSSNDCTVPDELSVSQITATTATLSWISYNADNWDLNYWETDDKAATSKTLTDVKPGYVLRDLKSSTSYTFEVASTCNPKYSEPFTFTTACPAQEGLNEQFEDGINSCWSQMYGLFDDVVADPTKLVLTEDGWNVTEIPMVGSEETKNARLTIAGADCANWLVSPVISITENSGLTFNLSFSAFDGTQQVNPIGQTDDRFIVAVSDDEGKTWKKENATVWDNAGGTNRVLNLIGNAQSRIDIDLSAYTGKNIRVAFYGESTVERESNDIHIDSVLIGCRVKEVVENQTACTGYSYYANGFEIDKAHLQAPGEYTFTRGKRAIAPDNCDTIVVLNLTVNESKVYEYDAVTCDNETYSDENFDNLSKSDTYRLVTTADNGCDSTIILNLVVNPTYNLDRTLEIDASELPYTFACKEFPVGTQSGKYVVECKTVNDCDSIINLNLVVNGGTGVDNVNHSEALILTPNPVEPGQMITVDYDFTADQLKGINLMVLNSVGQVVSVSTPEGAPVAFNAPQTAGVYTVRIITTDKQVLIGRFIVK